MNTQPPQLPQQLPGAAAQPPVLVEGDRRVGDFEMEIHGEDEDGTSTVWEWGNLLDFAIDDQLDISWNDLSGVDPVQSSGGTATTTTTTEQSNGSSERERVRKRDPRLICENFLAGRVPCSCPELDAMADEEAAEVEVEKKRLRTVTAAAAGGGLRCQVVGCEADISNLKGYHKRHRVCLQCAYATSVFLDGQPKRYCQQCGKFHTLPSFDEGKRSCRRKLEHHNKRRRRKPKESKGRCDKETQANHSPHKNSACDEVGKDSLCLSNHTGDEVLESEDGHASPVSLPPSTLNTQSEMSFGASTGGRIEVGKDNSKYTISSSYCDNKSAYSSVCPTGRISFKLYDWNPAEFPRRLRLQIFQWLANMPVELEGYIRPGCTILTVFITMPPFMWKKIQEEAASLIMNFISSPECLLFGRGPMIVYLNDMMFRVLKGGTSLTNVIKGQAPRLHYVHPNCFEAGKPVEFVACGSNLLQPKFRLLVSFCGRYLAYDHCLAISHGKTGLCPAAKEDAEESSDHQMYKIYIRKTEQKLFGPAFVEVENESGLSNFIPILFGDRQTCHEMQMVQRIFSQSLCSRRSEHAVLDVKQASCEELVLRQTSMSELLLDIAWLLKEPELEDMQNLWNSLQIRRLNCVLDFLLQNECTILLERLLQYSKHMMTAEKLCNPAYEINDVKLFQQRLHRAGKIVHQGLPHAGSVIMDSGTAVLKGDNLCHDCSEEDLIYIVPSSNQDKETMKDGQFGSDITSSLQQSNEIVPLINREVVMDVNYRSRSRHPGKVWSQKSCGLIFSGAKSRPLTLMVAATVVCVGMCVVLFHPHRVGEFAVSVRRCLFG